MPVLKVDNAAVRKTQIERLEKLRRERDGAAVTRSLDALTACAKGGPGQPARARRRRRARSRHRRGDLPRPREGLGPAPGGDPRHLRRVQWRGG